MYELINNKYIEVKEYKGQRVVTLKDIDIVHERPEGTARRNFNENKQYFIEGVDYFVRNSYEAKNEFNITAPNGLILLTLSGYLMIVKSFTDELSWSVQRMLVNAYFCSQNKQSEEKYSGISKTDIIEYIKYFCEQYTENYFYINRKIDNLIEENRRLRDENIKYKHILKKLYKKFL